MMNFLIVKLINRKTKNNNNNYSRREKILIKNEEEERRKKAGSERLFKVFYIRTKFYYLKFVKV
jgi:hypothetical protein